MLDGGRLRYIEESDYPSGGAIRVRLESERPMRVALHLPMTPRRTFAHPAVGADAGRVALERGPLVYCAEGPDNPGGPVQDLRLLPDAALADVWRSDALGPHVAISAKALRLHRSDKGPLYTHQRHPVSDTVLTAIPYYLWANREAKSMLVWVPEAAAGPGKTG